jgi:hypothetical protein
MVNVFKLLVKILLVFLSVCLTIVSLISGISVGLIFSDPNNINLQLNDTYININGTQLDLGMPYTINNMGFYDLNNMEFNCSVSAYNESDFFYVGQGIESMGNFPAQTITHDDFNLTIIMSESVNLTLWSLWNISLSLNIRLSGLYALDLIHFTFGFLRNYTFGGI